MSNTSGTAPVALDDDSRQDPESALTVLLQSDGWALFVAEFRRMWGAAAVNRRVKDILKEHPPSEHSAIIQGLYGTQEAMAQMLAWPEEEVERLHAHTAQQRAEQGAPRVDPFAKHRRV